jgi:hypothetical protein
MHMGDLEKTLLAFALTTVAGGAITTFYQWMVWKRQQQASYDLQTSRAREDIFAEVSRLLDRRLYRLRQMLWRAGDDDSPLREHWIEEYRTVVTEWNDSINRQLAMLQVYMSEDLRRTLDNDIGSRMVTVGRDVMECVTRRQKPSETLERAVDSLAGDTYAFNIRMLRHFDRRRTPNRL